MGTTRDRIRHTILFEIVSLAFVTPLGSLAFDISMTDIGIVSFASTTVAMVWNYIYNLGFDRLLQHLNGNTTKTLRIRIVHALLFELGLLIALMPFLAWYLNISPAQALMMDISFALFYMGYVFFFNLIYDRVFPVLPPEVTLARLPARLFLSRITNPITSTTALKCSFGAVLLISMLANSARASGGFLTIGTSCFLTMASAPLATHCSALISLSYFRATAKWVGLVITTIVSDTAAIMR